MQTPCQIDGIVNSPFDVIVDDIQFLAGKPHRFVRWADGPTLSDRIVFPPDQGQVTYTAIFEPISMQTPLPEQRVSAPHNLSSVSRCEAARVFWETPNDIPGAVSITNYLVQWVHGTHLAVSTVSSPAGSLPCEGHPAYTTQSLCCGKCRTSAVGGWVLQPYEWDGNAWAGGKWNFCDCSSSTDTNVDPINLFVSSLTGDQTVEHGHDITTFLPHDTQSRIVTGTNEFDIPFLRSSEEVTFVVRAIGVDSTGNYVLGDFSAVTKTAALEERCAGSCGFFNPLQSFLTASASSTTWLLPQFRATHSVTDTKVKVNFVQGITTPILYAEDPSADILLADAAKSFSRFSSGADLSRRDSGTVPFRVVFPNGMPGGVYLTELEMVFLFEGREFTQLFTIPVYVLGERDPYRIDISGLPTLIPKSYNEYQVDVVTYVEEEGLELVIDLLGPQYSWHGGTDIPLQTGWQLTTAAIDNVNQITCEGTVYYSSYIRPIGGDYTDAVYWAQDDPTYPGMTYVFGVTDDTPPTEAEYVLPTECAAFGCPIDPPAGTCGEPGSGQCDIRSGVCAYAERDCPLGDICRAIDNACFAPCQDRASGCLDAVFPQVITRFGESIVVSVTFSVDTQREVLVQMRSSEGNLLGEARRIALAGFEVELDVPLSYSIEDTNPVTFFVFLVPVGLSEEFATAISSTSVAVVQYDPPCADIDMIPVGGCIDASAISGNIPAAATDFQITVKVLVAVETDVVLDLLQKPTYAWFDGDRKTLQPGDWQAVTFTITYTGAAGDMIFSIFLAQVGEPFVAGVPQAVVELTVIETCGTPDIGCIDATALPLVLDGESNTVMVTLRAYSEVDRDLKVQVMQQGTWRFYGGNYVTMAGLRDWQTFDIEVTYTSLPQDNVIWDVFLTEVGLDWEDKSTGLYLDVAIDADTDACGDPFSGCLNLSQLPVTIESHAVFLTTSVRVYTDERKDLVVSIVDQDSGILYGSVTKTIEAAAEWQEISLSLRYLPPAGEETVYRVYLTTVGMGLSQATVSEEQPVLVEDVSQNGACNDPTKGCLQLNLPLTLSKDGQSTTALIGVYTTEAKDLLLNILQLNTWNFYGGVTINVFAADEWQYFELEVTFRELDLDDIVWDALLTSPGRDYQFATASGRRAITVI